MTAFWLRRVDPHQSRGRACFWFCLSLGVLRILIAAGAMAMLVVSVQCALQKADPNPNAGDDLPSRFYGVAVLMLVGAPCLTLFALLGYAHARKGGIRVWIDGLLAHARRDNVWPPGYSMEPVNPSQNRVRLAWVSALLTMGLLGLVLPIVVAIFAGIPAGAIVLAAESPLILFVSRRVIARHPADCWFLSDEGPWLAESENQ